MRNPYEVLGVKPSATDAEIRKAYRKLAKQCHPDLHPGNEAASARFREINAAHDFLSDPSKRQRFDRGEIDADGHESFVRGQEWQRGGFGFGFDPSAASHHGSAHNFRFEFGGGDDVSGLFSHLFGDASTRRSDPRWASDPRLALKVDFIEAVIGGKRRLTLPGGRSLDVSIPAGITDKQVLRLGGQAEGGGDLLLEVQIAPHPIFRREGDDIHVDLPITLAEAIEGGSVTVPTIMGRVAVKVPPNSNSGRVLRLKGKGIRHGDQYITLVVKLPDPMDSQLSAFIRTWSRTHPYDPRGDRK